MNILLINPFYYTIENFTYYEKFFDPIPVMGLAYIASELRSSGYNLKIIDDYLEKLGINGIINNISNFNPTIIGIPCLTPLADETIHLAKEIKKKFPLIKIILGNSHANIFSDELLLSGVADIIIHGEGEKVFLKVSQAIEAGSSLANVKGISYKLNEDVIKTEKENLIQDLNTINFPAWDLFDIHKYQPCPEVSPGGKHNLPILFSRGCPFNCIFCSQEMGGKVRCRSAKNLVDEMIWCFEEFGTDGFIFFDANFPFNKSKCIEVCKEIINSKLNGKITWTTETRPDLLDEEVLSYMQKSGCRKIQLGIESGSDKILKRLNKGFTKQQVIDCVKLIKNFDIKCYGLFIIGNPGESKKEIEETINFAINLDFDYAKFNLFVPYPGTAAYANEEIKQQLINQPFIHFFSYPPTKDRVIYTPDNISKEELLAYQKKAFLKFYLRFSMIFKQIFKIRSISVKEYINGAFLLTRFIVELFFCKIKILFKSFL